MLTVLGQFEKTNNMMKEIKKIAGLFLVFISFYSFGQNVVCPNDTIINQCDSAVVNYDTVSTSGFATIDSISYLFTVNAIDIDSGIGIGSDETFYSDSTLVEITIWGDSATIDTFATCTFYIVVTDTSPPDIDATDTIAYLDSAGGVKIDTSLFNPTITDNCSGIDSVWLSQDTFSCGIDTATVWIHALDSVGNRDSFDVELVILDTVAPDISGSNATVYLG